MDNLESHRQRFELRETARPAFEDVDADGLAVREQPAMPAMNVVRHAENQRHCCVVPVRTALIAHRSVASR